MAASTLPGLECRSSCAPAAGPDNCSADAGACAGVPGHRLGAAAAPGNRGAGRRPAHAGRRGHRHGRPRRRRAVQLHRLRTQRPAAAAPWRDRVVPAVRAHRVRHRTARRRRHQRRPVDGAAVCRLRAGATVEGPAVRHPGRPHPPGLRRGRTPHLRQRQRAHRLSAGLAVPDRAAQRRRAVERRRADLRAVGRLAAVVFGRHAGLRARRAADDGVPVRHRRAGAPRRRAPARLVGRRPHRGHALQPRRPRPPTAARSSRRAWPCARRRGSSSPARLPRADSSPTTWPTPLPTGPGASYAYGPRRPIAGRYHQQTWGADGEYSIGHFLARAELVSARWRLPAIGPTPIDQPLRSTGLSVEGRYRLAPGFTAAARVDRLSSASCGAATRRCPGMRRSPGWKLAWRGRPRAT